jgi:hypothetical protein
MRRNALSSIFAPSPCCTICGHTPVFFDALNCTEQRVILIHGDSFNTFSVTPIGYCKDCFEDCGGNVEDYE